MAERKPIEQVPVPTLANLSKKWDGITAKGISGLAARQMSLKLEEMDDWGNTCFISSAVDVYCNAFNQLNAIRLALAAPGAFEISDRDVRHSLQRDIDGFRNDLMDLLSKHLVVCQVNNDNEPDQDTV